MTTTSGNSNHTVVFGLCGATSGGKTTLARMLLEKHQSAASTIILQDNFYKEDSGEVPVSEDGMVKLWDDVSSLQVDRLLDAVRVAKSQAISQNAPGLQHLVIIDGTMLLNIKELRMLMDVAYFLTLDYDTMRERRSLRRDYGPLSDPPHYFEEHVWPAYMRDLKVACDAHQDGTVKMLDGTRDIDDNLQELENSYDIFF